MINAEKILLMPKQFISKILDSLPIYIAVLDINATVVFTNKIWQKFREENIFFLSKVLVGANYFQLCDDIKENTQELEKFFQGIEEVFSGKTEFEIENVFCSSTKKYWFLSKVTRFYLEEELFLIITHENITQCKLLEQSFI